MKVFTFLWCGLCLLSIPTLVHATDDAVLTKDGEMASGDAIAIPLEIWVEEEVSGSSVESEEVVSDLSDDGVEENENSLDDSPPEEIPLEDTPSGPTSECPESDLIRQIQDIAEDSRSREIGSTFDASYSLGYSSHGFDTTLLEYFFQGSVYSQEVSVSHLSGLSFSVTNLISAAGGVFSDFGDRTNLSIGLQRGFGSFYGALHHTWVHTNYRMDEWFFYADRHRTSIRSGTSLGLFHPYVFAVSDVPAYTPIDEMLIYGGVGAVLTVPIDPLRTEISVGASCAGSLFWYHHASLMRYRIHAGFVTSIGGISVHPEIGYLADVFTGGTMITTSFKSTF